VQEVGGSNPLTQILLLSITYRKSDQAIKTQKQLIVADMWRTTPRQKDKGVTKNEITARERPCEHALNNTSQYSVGIGRSCGSFLNDRTPHATHCGNELFYASSHHSFNTSPKKRKKQTLSKLLGLRSKHLVKAIEMERIF
jgi:hypothetical protein